IRWSDLDPNFHLRHSAYYDFGAYSRISFMSEHGITPQVLAELNIGPILFREECVFRKEIKFGDEVKINLRVEKAKDDFSRWTMVHEIFKNEAILCAVITIDGAWMDTVKRKLTTPPGSFKEIFSIISKDASVE
ncbi:MAG TPA: thioesterase family protein, partial [Ignavibacteriaceae bacterium]